MTAPATQVKPSKPYPDFPLTAAGSGQWSKSIRKRRYYFGPWADWKGALELYNAQRDHLYAGTTPPEVGVTVAGILNDYSRTKIQQGPRSRNADQGRLGRTTESIGPGQERHGNQPPFAQEVVGGGKDAFQLWLRRVGPVDSPLQEWAAKSHRSRNPPRQEPSGRNG
jgi:hypothetical protein